MTGKVFSESAPQASRREPKAGTKLMVLKCVLAEPVRFRMEHGKWIVGVGFCVRILLRKRIITWACHPAASHIQGFRESCAVHSEGQLSKMQAQGGFYFVCVIEYHSEFSFY